MDRKLNLKPPSQSPNNAISRAAKSHISPFRYPGGKTWLVPYVRHWLLQLPTKPELLVEPFCGGASISLAAVSLGLVDRVVMVERDKSVAAVWKTILGADRAWLKNRILNFELTAENVKAEIAQSVTDEKELAFRTILRNRVSHGGIMAPGSGLIKSGEGNRGLGSRWYPETLALRIEYIGMLSHKISFIEDDGVTALEKYQSNQDVVFFVDPPYDIYRDKPAGLPLYNHSSIDHDTVFRLTSGLAGNFLMTYDDNSYVSKLATKYGLKIDKVPMRTTKNATKMELLIGSDLKWLTEVGKK